MHGIWVKRANRLQADAGIAQNGVVFPEQFEEQMSGLGDRKQLAIIETSSRRDGANRCVVHQFGVLVRQDVGYDRHAKESASAESIGNTGEPFIRYGLLILRTV